MQIENLVLYSHAGEQRVIDFRLGQLNVITGDSQTGKSSLTNIFRYCLGSSSPGIPIGPISRTVAWYGMTVNIHSRRLFLARPAPDGSQETSGALLIVEPEGIPNSDDLHANTSRNELREFLSSAIGIEENLNVPPVGNTRAALSAAFAHSLYYCFQTQSEIASQTVLFHHQNLEFQSQAIRDTFPYFLGAQGLEELRNRERLAQAKRTLRAAEQRLRRAETANDESTDRAHGLLVEASDVGLVPESDRDGIEGSSLPNARLILQSLLDTPLDTPSTTNEGTEFEVARSELADKRERAREIAEQLQGLEDFNGVAVAYTTELREQQARLVSIGLVPSETHDAECPVCGSFIETGENQPDHALISAELLGVNRRLDSATHDRPRIEKARQQLLEEREQLTRRIAELNATLMALAEESEIVARERQRVNIQSYVRGKISEYLSTVEELTDVELDRLRDELSRLLGTISALEESLDSATIRARVESAVALVSRDITSIAQSLNLEHSSTGVRLDASRLTVVADTRDGPAFLDAGQIGSGLNWVGYHLAVYLALQRYFILNNRPVPRFILIDQPSQAFFPPDQGFGGDMEQLNDTDREHTKDLYRLMRDEVIAQDGELQVIALDHADFDDQWFQDCVVDRWRDGKALIPVEWYDDETSPI